LASVRTFAKGVKVSSKKAVGALDDDLLVAACNPDPRRPSLLPSEGLRRGDELDVLVHLRRR
jgi:hypothetical protein